MAQYYGDNVHCILDCVKGVLTAWKLTLLVLFYSLYGYIYDGENIYDNLGCPKGGQVASKLSLLE